MLNGDYNSKNKIWGSTQTDERGEYLLEWIRENKLGYLNDGSFTHKNSNGKKDVLDLMLIDMEFEYLNHA